MIAWLVTDLPDPDSPTIASVRPFSTEKSTPSTALTMPSSVGNWTRRSRTSRNGWLIRVPRGPERAASDSVVRSRKPHPGVDDGVEDVDNEVGDDDERRGQHDGAGDHRQVGIDDGLDRQL